MRQDRRRWCLGVVAAAVAVAFAVGHVELGLWLELTIELGNQKYAKLAGISKTLAKRGVCR